MVSRRRQAQEQRRLTMHREQQAQELARREQEQRLQAEMLARLQAEANDRAEEAKRREQEQKAEVERLAQVQAEANAREKKACQEAAEATARAEAAKAASPPSLQMAAAAPVRPGPPGPPPGPPGPPEAKARQDALEEAVRANAEVKFAAHASEYTAAEAKERAARERTRAERNAKLQNESTIVEAIPQFPSADLKQEEVKRLEDFLDSKSPIWRSKTYIGSFGDCYIADTDLEGGPAFPSIVQIREHLKSTLKSKRSWLSLFTTQPHFDALQKVISKLTETENFVNKLGELKFIDFLSWWKQYLVNMPVGGSLLTPGGWSKPHPEGHAVCYTIIRESANTYAFVTHNTGDGVGSHPATKRAYPKNKFKTSARISGIDKARFLNMAFWFGLWRMVRYQEGSNGANILYQALLPMLTDKSCQSSWDHNDPYCEWRTLQRSGLCYYKSALEGIRYLHRFCGLSNDQAKQLAVAVRHQYLIQVNEDLTTVRSVESSDIQLINIGVKNTIAAWMKLDAKSMAPLAALAEVRDLANSIKSRMAPIPLALDDGAESPPLLKLQRVTRWFPHYMADCLPRNFLDKSFLE